jgi:hypothetical protein
MIISKRMILAENVARMVEMTNAYKILVINSEERDYSEGIGLYGKVILDWILEK